MKCLVDIIVYGYTAITNFNMQNSNNYNISLESENKIDINKVYKGKYNYYSHYDVVIDNFNVIINFAKIAIYIVVVILIFICIKFLIDNFKNIYEEDLKKRYIVFFSLGTSPSQIDKLIKKECSILGITAIIISILIIILLQLFIKVYLSSLNINISLIGLLISIVVVALIMFKTIRNVNCYILNTKYIYKNISSKKTRDYKYLVGSVTEYKSASNMLGIKNYKRNKQSFKVFVNAIILLIASTIIISSVKGYFTQNYYKELDSNTPNMSVFYINQNSEKYFRDIRYDTLLDISKNNFVIKSSSSRDLSIKAKSQTNDKYYRIIAIGDENYKQYINELGLDITNQSGIIWYNKNYSNETVTKNIKKEGEFLISLDGVFNEKIIKVTDKLPFGCDHEAGSNGLYIISDKDIEKYNWQVTDIKIYTEKPYQLENILKEINNGYEIINVEREYKESNNIISIVNFYCNFLIFIVVLLGIINGINNIKMIFKNRKNEFKILRALGSDNKLFTKIFFIENLLITIKGIGIGALIGIVLSSIMYLFVKDIWNFSIDYIMILSYIIGILVFLNILTNYIFKKMKI